MKSQQLRKLAPELDSLRLGSGWKIDELSKPQIIVESSYGHSHPGSAHLDKLVDEAGIGIKEKVGLFACAQQRFDAVTHIGCRIVAGHGKGNKFLLHIINAPFYVA